MRRDEFVLHRRLDEPLDWRQAVFTSFAEYLRSTGREVAVVERFAFELRPVWRKRHLFELWDSLAFLEHASSGTLWVLDLHDWEVPFHIQYCLADRRVRRYLKAQFQPGAIRFRGASLVRPWTYFDGRWPFAENHLRLVRATPKTNRRLYFRGNTLDRRGPVIDILRARGILEHAPSHVPFPRYLEELAGAEITLSLPGMGDLCHRDIEAFAVGTCVLRPKLKNRTEDPLEPGTHYLAVDVDVKRDSPERVADAIEAGFAAAIEQPERLRGIAERACQWYERNVPPTRSMPLTADLLDLPAA